ncbi:LytTR family DNA-binding domain-containing protein [Mangrovibacterium marinum]|uniref:LytTR family two component transcriptional regulator n=1 Tax=Mangrovibacterium marinum TaxID=1639118 RepID=A0A2T5C0S8_9BACT|nr:LytTR family DNA-binding domain-containing protein [Mangrovibacterium marinum]PTN08215.1 LytTR family two component transcriptional regulator [Mangrovibacterium marinum]
MKVLIVEDETVAFENLSAIITAIDPTIQVIGNTESIRQTVHWMQHNQKPDLIFMDIHLSDGSAFAIFDAIEIETPVIFTTAYDEHAIEAFKVNSIDYLLKPIKPEELERALHKFRKWTSGELATHLSNLADLSPRSGFTDKILVPWKDQLKPVNVHDIAFFYTSEKNTSIHLKSGQSYPYAKALEQIISTLNPSDFIRANKQFIVARDSVTNITVWFDNRLLVTLDVDAPERIFISKNKASEFKAWLVNKRPNDSAQ